MLRQTSLLCVLSVVAISGNAIVAPAIAASDKAMRPLLGSWAGVGTMMLHANRAEKVRCTAYNTKGEAELRMVIRCASTSYRVEIRSQLRHRNGRLSGRWEERTYNASGNITGTIGAGLLHLTIGGGGFTGRMDVRFGTDQQTVAVKTQGIELRQVDIELGKAAPR